jgi:hypothetical protein
MRQNSSPGFSLFADFSLDPATTHRDSGQFFKAATELPVKGFVRSMIR